MLDAVVGYFMAALEDEEHARAAAIIASDADARRLLATIDRLLAPLDTLRGQYDAPAGLAQRTCVRIRASVQSTIEFAASPEEPPSATRKSDAP